MSLYSIDSNGNQVLKLSKILLNSLPKNFRVDGTLDCSGSSIYELPEGLIVRKDLILTNSNITELPSDILVCGRVYYNNLDLKIPEAATACRGFCINQKLCRVPFFDSEMKVMDKYIYCKDNIIPYTNKFENTEEKYIYYRGAFEKYGFVIYNDIFYDICKDLKDAKYKVMRWKACERNVEKYNNLNLNTPISLETAIALYKDFTGACDDGVEKWCEKYLPQEIRDTQQTSILELLHLTKTFYFNGSDLIEEYFTNNHQFVF